MHETIIRLANVWKTCNKIRAAAFRVGLSLWDWFRPLDPDGNSLISESKFVSVLRGPLSSIVGLSDEEIVQLADYFRTQDGRVFYHQLCTLIHGEDSKLSAQQTAASILETCPPPPEPECHTLDKWQMNRLCVLLATIAERELPLEPYFQDYELVAKNDGRITFAHFSRILNFIGIRVSAEDFNLLVRKFIKDSYTLDYVAFLEAVQAVKREGIKGLGPNYQNPSAIINTQPPKLLRPEIDANIPTSRLGGRSMAFHPVLETAKSTRDLVKMMLRVQEFVMQRRIRVSEFFRDYDRLNCGRIAPQDFLRGLDAIGLSSVLSPNEMVCVTNHYRDPNDHDKVCWRTFEDDCDQVFTTKELEKHPTYVPGQVAEVVKNMPPLGTSREAGNADITEAIARIKLKLKEKSIDLRVSFRDHDKNQNGHVSRSEAQRVLGQIGTTPPEHLAALETRFKDNNGFNYAALLKEIEEMPQSPGETPTPHTTVQSSANPHETDIVLILAKIKGKMVREGVRPLEFLRQHDTNNELVIPRADFYRGLACTGLSLTPIEMETLMDVFAAPGRRRYIEYYKFCETVGEALTQGGLERAPLLEPIPHLPTADSPINFLNFEERSIMSGAMQKLAKFPDQISNILEIFKDMDSANCGSVPRLGVEKALCRRELLHLLSSRERDILCKCFGCGNEGEINYRNLCKALDVIFATSRRQPC